MTQRASSDEPGRLPNAPAGTHPTTIGPYEVVRYLAAGGMADLYLARLPGTQKLVVCKRIAERYADIKRIVEMFLDEGRIASVLEHPNIVRIVETGASDGFNFIAMEYIPGRDLLHILRRAVESRKMMPRELAISLVLQVARGLVHAHEKRADDHSPLRIVHCDISPGNIVVSWGGTAKIVDFGIARAAIQERDEAEAVAGKYNYMAPEQIRGDAVDGRADLFSLGVILYELCLGRRLFRGRPEQVMHKVLEAPIESPRAIDAEFPDALETIVMRALDRDPETRYPTARAFYDALRAYLTATGTKAGKRELALYLREIYAAEKLQESEEFNAPADDLEAVLHGHLREAGSRLIVDEDDAGDLPLEVVDAAPVAVTPRALASPPPSGERLASILAFSLLGLALLVALSFLVLR